jgi:hypothetical protein
MSLWLESLCGYGGGNVDAAAPRDQQLEQARHILAHLAMPVPRMWWAQAQSNRRPPRYDYLTLVRRLREELLKIPSLADQAGIAELIAVAFIDEASGGRPEFGNVSSQHTPDQYLGPGQK